MCEILKKSVKYRRNGWNIEGMCGIWIGKERKKLTTSNARRTSKNAPDVSFFRSETNVVRNTVKRVKDNYVDIIFWIKGWKRDRGWKIIRKKTDEKSRRWTPYWVPHWTVCREPPTTLAHPFPNPVRTNKNIHRKMIVDRQVMRFSWGIHWWMTWWKENPVSL